MKTLLSLVNRAAQGRSLLAVLVGLLILTLAVPAFAAGRVVWKSTTLEERKSNESWYLEMEIHLPRAPDIAHKSMRFEFTQTAEYERSLVDGQDGPVTRTVPLTNQQPIVESQTVGFMDPGTGKTQARTRFSFKVTRAHGYRAGTWKVTIKDGDTGAQIGTTTNLTLKGENEVVDRRSIVFTGSDKKKKDEEKKEEESSEEPAPTEEAPADESSAEEPTYDEGEGDVPPSIEEKPGGGCHHSPHDTSTGWPLLVLVLGVGVFLVRRIRS